MSKKCIACGERLYNNDYEVCIDSCNVVKRKFDNEKYSYYYEHDLIKHYHDIFCKAKKDTKKKLKTHKIDMIVIAIIQHQRYNNPDIWQNKLKSDLFLLDGISNQLQEPIFDLKAYKKDFNIEQPIKQRRYITEDGHIVKSRNEQKIDNMLYHAQIAHAYEKRVDEITEKSIYCDWYIPVIGDKGVYIELWGDLKGKYKHDKYELNKENKKALYEKHNHKLVEFESLDFPDDQEFQTKLIEEIKQKSDEVYANAQKEKYTQTPWTN